MLWSFLKFMPPLTLTGRSSGGRRKSMGKLVDPVIDTFDAYDVVDTCSKC